MRNADDVKGDGKVIPIERQDWNKQSQERAVEKFYSHGADKFVEIHGGYLNFGLWEEGVSNYLEAAEALIRKLTRWGRIGAESEVLDVGCGTGAQDVLIGRELAPKRLTGLDLTWDHVQTARRRARQAGLEDKVQFVHGTAVELKFEPESFTHVLGVEGNVHFDTREKFFQEAFRVLEPGGQLILADYVTPKEPGSLVEKALLRGVCKAWHVPEENQHTAAVFAEKLRRTGFTEVEIVVVGEKTIPPYVREQFRRSHLGGMLQVRGAAATAGGLALDAMVMMLYKVRLLDYVLVRAVKPQVH